MDNGVWRKVSGWSDVWVTHTRPQEGWLVYLRIANGVEAYAMDLVGNLLLDTTGHVIPQ
jgi:hypothetical protein